MIYRDQATPVPCHRLNHCHVQYVKAPAFHGGGLGEVLLPSSLLFSLRGKTTGARCVLGSRFHYLMSIMGRYQGFQDGGPQHFQGRFFMQKKYCLHCGFFSNTKHFHKIQGTTKRFPLQRKGEYSIFQRFWYFRTQVVQLCVLVSDRQRLPSRD